MDYSLWSGISWKIDLYTIQKPAGTKATIDAGEDAPIIDASILEGRPPDRARREDPKVGTRCKMGCYVCARTRSSCFHQWRNSTLAFYLEKIDALRPESEEICDQCRRAALRNSRDALERGNASEREVCPVIDMRSIANDEGLCFGAR